MPGRAAEIGTGKWWIGLTDEARDKFIERYTKAMDHVMSDLVTECTQGMKSLLAGAHRRSGGDEVDIMSNFTLCKVFVILRLGFGTHKELDAFYKDATSLTVPMEVALPRIRDALAVKHPRGAIGIV